MPSNTALMVVLLFALSPMLRSQEPATTPPPASQPRIFELKPNESGLIPNEQIRDWLRRVAERDLENERQRRNYTYVQREEVHELDENEHVKKDESTTSEVLRIYGEHVERVIAKNDKPLSEPEVKKEEERIQKIIDKRKNESEHDREKRIQEDEKRREDARKFVLEVAEAYSFRLVGSAIVNGIDTWVLDGEPRPGYRPKQRETKFMTKVKGRIWISKSDEQWVKVDITMTDTISFGLVLARIHKGTRVVAELTRVNDEVWLPRHVSLHLDARVALFKKYNQDMDQTFRDYKKFRTDTKITVIGETE